MNKQTTKYKQTEIGEIPEDWNIGRLGDYCNVRGGKRLPKGESLIETKTTHPYIRIKDITDEGINKSNLQYLTETTYQKIKRYIINEGNVYISIVGTIGLSGIIDKDLDGANLTENAAKLFDFDGLDAKFISYFLKSPAGQRQIRSRTVGSTQSKLALFRIGNIVFPLSKLYEQQQIASILSSLDNKIELNRKMNKTLEEIGQALFKRWFVDFEFPNKQGKPYKSSGGKMVDSELGEIPEGWDVKKIGDLNITVTDFVANGSFASLKKNTAIKDKPDYAFFLRNTDLKADFASGYKYVDKHSYEFLAKTKLYGGEVIISNVGDVGSVYRCPFFEKPMTLGNNQIVIKAKEKNLFFYLLFKSSLGKSLIASITTGSVQNKFNKTDFRNLQIVRPQNDVLQLFLSVIKPLYEKIETINKELKNVISLRDSLLPRLMSGKLRVN